MKIYFCRVIIGMVSLLLMCQRTTANCPVDMHWTTWKPEVSTGSCFVFYTFTRTYNKAKDVCRTNNGSMLAMPKNNKINTILWKTWPEDVVYNAWIGIKKEGNVYKWLDGTKAKWLNFQVPDDDGYNCVAMRKFNRKWKHMDCNTDYGYFCEKKIKPILQREPTSGDTATLTCKTNIEFNKTDGEFVFYKDGNEIKNTNDNTNKEDGITSQSISVIVSDEVKVYSCAIRGKLGLSDHSNQITVGIPSSTHSGDVTTTIDDVTSTGSVTDSGTWKYNDDTFNKYYIAGSIVLGVLTIGGTTYFLYRRRQRNKRNKPANRGTRSPTDRGTRSPINRGKRSPTDRGSRSPTDRGSRSSDGGKASTSSTSNTLAKWAKIANLAAQQPSDDRSTSTETASVQSGSTTLSGSTQSGSTLSDSVGSAETRSTSTRSSRSSWLRKLSVL